MIRLSLACLLIALAFPWPASASVDICSDPRMQSRLAFELVAFGESSFDEIAGSTDLQYNNYDLLFTTAGEKYLFGYAHRYNKFDVKLLQPETNGHLHTLFLPLHVLFGDVRRNFRFSIAPSLSASSNVANRPDEYTSDTVQVLAALIWGRQVSDRVSLRFGICGDHRFGKYQLYPAVSVLWQPHPDWKLELGFPASKINYRVSDSLSSEISIEPDGNEWYVLDDSRTRNSQFVYEAYAIDWSINWELMRRFLFTATIGKEFANRYEFRLLDQSVASLSGDPVTRVAVALEWRF